MTNSPGQNIHAELVAAVVKAYRKTLSHPDLVQQLGIPLHDVTDLRPYAPIEAAMPLPPGFTERVYNFEDPLIGRGVMDAAFHGPDLVNVRINIFFRGSFARSKARRYMRDVVAPILQAEFGTPVAASRDHFAYRGRGLVSITRLVSAGPSVSTYVTDERFA